MSMDMVDFSIIGQAGISTIPMMDVESDNGFMSQPKASPTETAIFQQRLRARIEELGTTPRAVSIAIGANQGYVRDLLDPEKTSTPSAARARALAAELKTTTDWLFGHAENSAQPVSEVSISPLEVDWRSEVGKRLPVYGTGYCDDLEISDDGNVVAIEQTLFDPSNTVAMIQRPPALRYAIDAYAIYYHGISMEPRFFQGEIGIVTPSPPPGHGDFVVVQLNDGSHDDVIHVLVKRLIRSTSSYVELEQFNPPLKFRIDRKRVSRMHKILGPNELYTR